MTKKNFLFRIFCFSLLFYLLFTFLEQSLFDFTYVSSTWDDIQDPNAASPALLLMGNSHAFVSTDVELMGKATGLKAETLGSPAQNMTVTLDNLKLLLQYKKPAAIILEVNAAILENQEQLLNEKRGYLLENYDGYRNPFKKFAATLPPRFSLDQLPEAMFQLCRPTNIWRRWKEKPESLRKDTLGYIPKIGYGENISLPEGYSSQIEALYENQPLVPIADYNEKALREFLEITEREQIPVYLYKNLLLSELETSDLTGMISYVKALCGDYENAVWLGDLNLKTAQIGLNSYDFWDAGHLNRRGAVKAAVYLLDLLEKEGLCKTDYTYVFHYKTENVRLLENGLYRYTVENFDDLAQFEFTLKDQSQILVKKEFSKENYIDLSSPLGKAQTLTVRMVPGCCDVTNWKEIRDQNISLRFMKGHPSETGAVMP